jgi:hypothetical protein
MDDMHWWESARHQGLHSTTTFFITDALLGISKKGNNDIIPYKLNTYAVEPPITIP